jgi:ankyrin repeat protein
LRHGVDPNRGPSLYPNILIPYITNSGDALNAAASHGSVDTLNLLLEHGAKLENSIALHYAAESDQEGRVSVMERLLQLRMDINRWDWNIRDYAIGPPLFYTIKSGNPSHVWFVLENGGNPLLRNRLGQTAVEAAELGASGQIVELLKQAKGQQNLTQSHGASLFSESS